MPTLEAIEGNIRTALAASSYVVRAAWSLPEARLPTGPNARVKVTQSETLDAGSNVAIRTVEATVQITALAAGIGSAALATTEALVNGYFEELTAASYWAAVTGVRASPLPETEVDSEPERVGRCITFTIRVRFALEA